MSVVTNDVLTGIPTAEQIADALGFEPATATQGAAADAALPAADLADALAALDNAIIPTFAEGPEIADPAAPAANKGRLYFKDVGGKTALVARFPTGAVQQIAVEP